MFTWTPDLHHLPAPPTASESQLGPHWSTVGPEPGCGSASRTSLGSEVAPPSSPEAAASPRSSKRKVKKPLIQSEPSSAKMSRTSSSDSAFRLPPPSVDQPDGGEGEGRMEGTEEGPKPGGGGAEGGTEEWPKPGGGGTSGKEIKKDAQKETRRKGKER